LCPDCRAELPWLGHRCRRCALPLPPEAQVTLCADCQISPPALDSCQALFAYQEPVKQWLQGLKFNGDLGAGRLLGELVVQQLSGNGSGVPPAVVPVPLHRSRLRQRGYNQSLEIARPLRRHGYSLAPDLCRRSKATSAQSDLPARMRAANVRNAFYATRPLDGRHLLLIDYVMTTGATLNALARTLKRAGAARVDAWVIARTNKNGDRC
jgi:ComF family protein